MGEPLVFAAPVGSTGGGEHSTPARRQGKNGGTLSPRSKIYLEEERMRAIARPVVLIALTALAFGTAAPAPAKKGKKGAPTAPGKYEDWRGEIDVLEIVQTFQRSGYQKIVVSGLDTSKTPLPEADDNTYEPVKEVLADPVTAFVEGLREDSGMTVEKGQGGPGDLVVSGVVEELDPGSRAARYWGGFGAGAARAVLRLEVRDGASGKTLLKIHQERRSGFGVGGGSYVNLLNRNLRQIGGDVALVLTAF
jgi:hypothetical protein